MAYTALQPKYVVANKEICGQHNRSLQVNNYGWNHVWLGIKIFDSFVTHGRCNKFFYTVMIWLLE